MTITVWRVLCVVSAVLFVAGLVLLLLTRLLKNKYYHVFTADELMTQNKLANGKNSVYFTSGETKNYINKYAICKTEFDKYLVCKFVKKFAYLRYFVLEYSAHGRVVKVQQVDEYDTGANSRIITLHRRCAKVNVVIGTADDVEINSDVIRPLSRKRIRLFALLKSFTLFAFLFAARHIVLEIMSKISGPYQGLVGYYLQDTLNYISIGVCLIIGLLSYGITVLCFRRKNVKALNGGVVEYEFV